MKKGFKPEVLVFKLFLNTIEFQLRAWTILLLWNYLFVPKLQSLQLPTICNSESWWLSLAVVLITAGINPQIEFNKEKVETSLYYNERASIVKTGIATLIAAVIALTMSYSS